MNRDPVVWGGLPVSDECLIVWKAPQSALCLPFPLLPTFFSLFSVSFKKGSRFNKSTSWISLIDCCHQKFSTPDLLNMKRQVAGLLASEKELLNWLLCYLHFPISYLCKKSTTPIFKIKNTKSFWKWIVFKPFSSPVSTLSSTFCFYQTGNLRITKLHIS